MQADGKMVWLINHTDYHTASNAPPLKVSLEILSILQNHYPERLGLAIMFNPPMSMSVFWNMVKPFVDPVTSQKVQFVSGRNPEKARNELSKVRGDRPVAGDEAGLEAPREHCSRHLPSNAACPSTCGCLPRSGLRCPIWNGQYVGMPTGTGGGRATTSSASTAKGTATFTSR